LEGLANRKNATALGGVAIGLAGLAFAAYEINRRARVKPESLLDERAQGFRNGSYFKSAAVLLGGPAIMARHDIQQITGLSRHLTSHGVKLLVQHGLAVHESFLTNGGTREDHYMLTQALPQAVVENPDAYSPLIDVAKMYYPDFTVESLAERFGFIDNS